MKIEPRVTRSRLSLLRAAAVAAFLASGASVASAQDKVTFQDHALPIFRNACLNCHNPEKKKAGLDLSSYAATMAGGENGKVIEPGDPDGSLLYRLVARVEEPFMPPKGDKMPDKDLDALKKWIAGGVLETSGSAAVVSNKPKVDLKIANVTSGKPEGPPPMPQNLVLEPVVRAARPGQLVAMATSPWAPLAALGGQKQVLLYHTQTLELLGVLPFPEGVPQVLQFSRSGGLLLAGGGVGAKSGKVVLFDVTNGNRVTELGDEFDAVLAADISADQSTIALGGSGKQVKILNTATGATIKTIKKHTDWITAVGYSPDGVLLATGDRNGGLRVWEASGGEFYTLSGHKSAITRVNFRGDSNVLASASEDGSVKLWDMNSGNEIKTWNPHNGQGVSSVHFTHDGRLVTSGRDKFVRVWGPDGAALKQMEPAFADIALHAAFNEDGTRAIGGDWTGQVRVWTVTDAKPAGELTANPPTIAERLVEIEKRIVEQQAASDKVAATFAAVREASNKAAADLLAAQANMAAAQKMLEASTAALAAANTAAQAAAAELKAAQDALAPAQAEAARLTLVSTQTNAAKDAATNEHTQLTQAAAAKQQAGDAAAQAYAAAKAAADAQPADQNLAAAAAAAKTKADAAAAELAPAQQAVTAKAEQLRILAEAATKAAGELTAANAKVAEAQKLVEAKNGANTAAAANVAAATAAMNKSKTDLEAATAAIPPKTEAAKIAAEAAAKLKPEADAAGVQVASFKHQQGKLRAAQVFAALRRARDELAFRKSEQENGPAVIAAAQKAVEKANADVAAMEKHIAEHPQRLAALEQAAAPLKAAAEAAAKASADATAVAEAAVAKDAPRVQELTAAHMAARAQSEREPAAADKKKAADDAKAALDTANAELDKLKAAAAAADQASKAALAAAAAPEAAVAKEKTAAQGFAKKLAGLTQIAATMAADVPKVQQAAAEAPAKAAAAQAEADRLAAEHDHLIKEIPPAPAAPATPPVQQAKG